MSVGSNLQEMENVVTKGAKPAEPMSKVAPVTPGQEIQDLGGPTVDNYSPTDDSAKLEVGKTVMQVKDVVNAKAHKAMPMENGKSMKEEEVELEDENLEVVSEEEVETEAEEISEEECDKEMKHDKKHDKKKMMKKDEDEEEDEDMEESIDFNIEDDVEALFEGEELTEEFQEKARVIFEAAINSRVGEIKEDLAAAYEATLVEEIAEIKSSLTERVDAYLEYVADEWMSENAIAIEQGLKSEMTESFLEGMKGLFEEHYVTIPEDRYDVLESMVEKLDEMEGKLNEQIERNVALNSRLAESVSDVILADVAEGLALSQKEKLASLAENVEFDGEDNYREKLVTLRESYFPTNTGTQRDHSETISEGMDFGTESVHSKSMETYLQTLNRVSKK